MGQRLGGEAGGRAQQSALCDSDAALTPVAPPTSLKCRLRFVAHVGLLTLLQMVGEAPYFFLEKSSPACMTLGQSVGLSVSSPMK